MLQLIGYNSIDKIFQLEWYAHIYDRLRGRMYIEPYKSLRNATHVLNYERGNYDIIN